LLPINNPHLNFFSVISPSLISVRASITLPTRKAELKDSSVDAESSLSSNTAAESGEERGAVFLLSLPSCHSLVFSWSSFFSRNPTCQAETTPRLLFQPFGGFGDGSFAAAKGDREGAVCEFARAKGRLKHNATLKANYVVCSVVDRQPATLHAKTTREPRSAQEGLVKEGHL
jgi:hypothetical protein